MTVNVENPDTILLPTGAALGPFSTVWSYAAPEEVLVVIEVDGVEGEPLALGVDYTVLGVPREAGGSTGEVTLRGAALPGGGWQVLGEHRLILRRRTNRSQSTPYGQVEGFRPRVVEISFDDLVRQVQELTALVARAVLGQAGERGLNLPAPGLRGDGRYLTFKDGQLATAGAVAAGQLASDFGQELILSETGAAARTVLGVAGSTDGTKSWLGETALTGNAGANNTVVGYGAGAYGSGGLMSVLGQGANMFAGGDFASAVGVTSNIYASGAARTSIGALAGRLGYGGYTVSLGFAAGQGLDGENNICIGNHAGSPTRLAYPLSGLGVDPVLNRITSNTPALSVPTDLAIGRYYRLQFENGAGTAPAPLASVSTLVRLISNAGGVCVWQAIDVDITTSGAGAYTCGLCFAHYDGQISIGDSAFAGPNEARHGFSNTRWLLPSLGAVNVVSMGRSPYETDDVYPTIERWRSFCFRWGGLFSLAGEPTWLDLGVGDVRRWRALLDVGGDLSIVRFDMAGVSQGAVLTFKADGRIATSGTPVYADNAAALAGGLVAGDGYRTASGVRMEVY